MLKKILKKELEFILQQGEGLKIEFKEGLNNIDREIVAFANAEGGRIFLGISDDRKIKGINIAKFFTRILYSGVPVNVPVNKRQEMIISLLIKKGKITTKEISSKFKAISLKTIQRDLADLKKRRIILFAGAPKKGYYVLKAKQKEQRLTVAK